MIQQSFKWTRIASQGELFSSVFKLLQYDQNRFFYNSAPKNKVNLVDNNLQILSQYKTTSNCQSIATNMIDGQVYLSVGCANGNIQLFNVNSKECIKTLLPVNNQQNFCNDIQPINNTLIVNCYNNGSICLWDIYKGQRIHLIHKLHDSYTYKLRIHDNMLFSCGHDRQIAVTDLELMTKITSLIENQSVWGINMCNQYEIATVGLFGAAHIWDLRSNKVCQRFKLTKEESSFVLKMNSNELVTGDQKEIKILQRRNGKSHLVANVLVSCEAILPIKEDKIVLAGRGGDVSVYSTKPTEEDIKIRDHFYSKIYDLINREEQWESEDQVLDEFEDDF